MVTFWMGDRPRTDELQSQLTFLLSEESKLSTGLLGLG